MSTHLPGFQSFFSLFASFYLNRISHQQHKGKSSAISEEPLCIVSDLMLEVCCLSRPPGIISDSV